MTKQSSFNLDGEDKDLLLFDYLEGNLTPEKARSLEEALGSDPGLSAELENWKASFVVQDFYATSALEQELLTVPARKLSVSGPAAGFAIVLLMSLFSFLPVGETSIKKSMHGVVFHQYEPKPARKTKKETAIRAAQSAQVSTIAKKHEQPFARKKAVHVLAVNKIEEDRILEAKALKAVPTRIQDSALKEDVASFIPSTIALIKSKQDLQPKAVQPKQITRKEQREIRKMKEKALQRKKAMEFIKGDRPYVVPLNSQNF